MWYFPGFTSEDTLPYAAAEEGQAVDTGETQNAAETEAEDPEEAQSAATEAAEESSQAQTEDAAEDELFMDGEEASGDSDGAATGEEASAAQEETQSLDENEVPAAEAATAKQWVWNPTMTFMIPTTIRKRHRCHSKGKNIPIT